MQRLITEVIGVSDRNTRSSIAFLIHGTDESPSLAMTRFAANDISWFSTIAIATFISFRGRLILGSLSNA
jgi:hypothetical protein